VSTTVSGARGAEEDRCISVLVLRHAESTWNAAGRWQGQEDPPLTEAGETQASAALARPDGYEPVSMAASRALEALVEIGDSVGAGPILMVTHGGILRALRAALGAGHDTGFPNLGGQWFHVRRGRVEAGDPVDPLAGQRRGTAVVAAQL
jgi:broad specificity phosphatase PhoE